MSIMFSKNFSNILEIVYNVLQDTLTSGNYLGFIAIPATFHDIFDEQIHILVKSHLSHSLHTITRIQKIRKNVAE